jgi:hypothetical protein
MRNTTSRFPSYLTSFTLLEHPLFDQLEDRGAYWRPRGELAHAQRQPKPSQLEPGQASCTSGFSLAVGPKRSMVTWFGRSSLVRPPGAAR